MKTQDAISHLKTSAALADLLGITPAAISQWGDYPPPARQLQLEKLTGLKAESDCLERLTGIQEGV
jgi:DNA-binding transcriptional regulator YdaS (Cro superfamily)